MALGDREPKVGSLVREHHAVSHCSLPVMPDGFRIVAIILVYLVDAIIVDSIWFKASESAILMAI